MLVFFFLILSIWYSNKTKSLPYFFLYQIIVVLCIFIYLINGIDVVYKADLSKTSDSQIYYSAFISDFSVVSNFLFYQYPLFLKILVFPLNDALFAVYGQSVLLFFFLDILLRVKQNHLLFIFNHSLIFTTTNMFKDNLILLVGLLAFILIKFFFYKSVVLSSLIFFISFYLIAMVRPFFSFLYPFSLFPIWSKIKSKKIKILFVFIILFLITFIIFLYKDLILYVMNNWSTDASVQEGKSSPPAALLKVFLGPTPFHYLFHEQYFVQPFLDLQAVFFFILHIIYYITFAFFCTYIISNYKMIGKQLFGKNIAYLYILSISIFLLIIYVIAYGSADIRQRALIITFLYVALISDKVNIFQRKMSINIFMFFILFLSLLGAITIKSY